MHIYNVVWFMSQTVHWPNGQDYGTPLKGAQEGINIRITAQSVAAENAVHQMHEINWKEAEVVTSHPDYCQICVLEAWHIHTEHQTIYHDEGRAP